MADINDLAQKLAFYQGGGKDPGTATLDKVNSGIDLIGQTVKDVLAIKKANYESQKLKTENTSVGKFMGVPSAQEEAAQNQVIANKNSTQIPENIYPQPTAQGENGIPNTPLGPSQAIPTPSPMLNARADFQAKNKFSPDTPLSAIPEVLKVAALNSGIPMFINDATQQISFDPHSVLMGYRPFTSLKDNQAATAATANANATRPMPVMTEADALAKTAAGAPPTHATKVVQGTTASLEGRADSLANAMMSGGIPPDVTKLAGGRGGLGSMVLEKLAAKGYDYRGENLKWQQAVAGTVGLTKSLNSTQMVQLQSAFNTIQQDIQPMRDISAELERVGFNPANRLIISARLNGVQLDPSSTGGMNGDQVQVATKYVTQINLMRDNMAVAFMRGGVPTDQAFKLTEQILNPVYSNPQINAALDQVQKNLEYRENAISDVAVRMPGGQGGSPPPIPGPQQTIEQKRAALRERLLGGSNVKH